MFRAIATIGVIQALVILTSLVRSKILAVQLGPEGVGVLGVIDQVVQLIAYISALSLPVASNKFLSRAHSEGFDVFRRTYGNLLRLLVVLTSIGTIISLTAVLFYPQVLGSELGPYRMTVIAAIVRIPIMASHGYFTHLLAAAQRWRTSVLLLLIIGASLAVTTPIGIALGGLPGMYISNLVAESLVAAGMLLYLRRRLGLPVFDRGASVWGALRETPSLVAFGSIIFVTSVLHLLSSFVARYMVFSYEGDAAAGLLQAAIALASSMSLLFNQATTLFLMPMMNRAGSKEGKFKAAQKYQYNLIMMVGLMGMSLILFAPLFLTAMFSSEFVAANEIVYLFVAAQALTLLSAVFQSVIVGLDDLKVYGGLVAAGHISLALASWLVVPFYGLVGVGVAVLLANGLIFLLTFGQLVVKHGFVAQRRLFLMLAYVLLFSLGVGIVTSQRDTVELTTVGAEIVFFAVYSVGLALLFGLDELRRLLGRAILWLERHSRSSRIPGHLRVRRRYAGALVPVAIELAPPETEIDAGNG